MRISDCSSDVCSSDLAVVLGTIYTGFATATEAAAVGVIGALILSSLQGSMNWAVFKESLMGATRLYCMIALILAGAQFLTLSMGYIGLPRALAEWIASLGLSQFGQIGRASCREKVCEYV